MTLSISNEVPSEPKPAVDPPPRSAPRRILILANPKAGGLQIAELFARLSRRAEQIWRRGTRKSSETVPAASTLLSETAANAGLEANVEAVPPPSRLPDLVRAAQAEGVDTLVAVGGDGTVRTVAQALVGSSLRLGILPLGTANNFAHALGLPFDLSAAMQVVASGVERQVDVGRIGDEYFLEAAGVGLFADVLQAFEPDEPRKHELLRLLKICGPLCWNPSARNLRLTLDGEEFQEETVMVAVANDAYLGASMEIAPGAGLSDGLFDVVIVGAMDRWELLRFAQALRTGKHLELPKVHRVQAKTVAIRCIHRSHRPLPVHADDHIAAYTPAYLEVVPKALRVLVPASK